MGYPVSTANANFAYNAVQSNILSTGGGFLAGLIIPSTWTTASIALFGSVDGVNFFQVYDSAGNAVTITAGASTMVMIGDETKIPTEVLKAMLYFKLQSGATGSTVEQAASGGLDVICILVKSPLPGSVH
jgi:hypothetical protein